MNWQADVLSTVKAVNKAIARDSTRGDNNLHLTSVDNTPKKRRRKIKIKLHLLNFHVPVDYLQNYHH